jgi:hypothetical protein
VVSVIIIILFAPINQKSFIPLESSQSLDIESEPTFSICDTYKLKLLEKLKVKLIFHVYVLKLIFQNSRPTQRNDVWPPLEFINNEPKFGLEAMLKSRQSQGPKWEYVVKWKIYHAIESPWV